MKFEIIGKKEKPFQTDEGDRMNYFWYTARRGEDGVVIQFGSIDGSMNAGEMHDITVEKFEGKNGKVIYKQIT